MAVTADIAHRIPAGWYPDRENRSRRRWWNGEEWTEYYSAAPTQEQPTIVAHSLRRAITFKDKVAASTVGGLLLANLVLILLVARVV